MENEIKREKKLINDIAGLSSLRSFFQKKYEEVCQALQELTLYKDTSDLYPRLEDIKNAIDTLGEKEKSLQQYKSIIEKRIEGLRQAKVLEDFGDLQGAARSYALCGEYVKSARLYHKAGKFMKAGDSYFAAGEYQKALKMYLSNGQKNSRLAQTYEALEEFRKAAQVWKALGRAKESQRCMRKVRQLSLFDLDL